MKKKKLLVFCTLIFIVLFHSVTFAADENTAVDLPDETAAISNSDEIAVEETTQAQEENPPDEPTPDQTPEPTPEQTIEPIPEENEAPAEDEEAKINLEFLFDRSFGVSLVELRSNTELTKQIRIDEEGTARITIPVVDIETLSFIVSSGEALEARGIIDDDTGQPAPKGQKDITAVSTNSISGKSFQGLFIIAVMGVIAIYLAFRKRKRRKKTGNRQEAPPPKKEKIKYDDNREVEEIVVEDYEDEERQTKAPKNNKKKAPKEEKASKSKKRPAWRAGIGKVAWRNKDGRFTFNEAEPILPIVIKDIDADIAMGNETATATVNADSLLTEKPLETDNSADAELIPVTLQSAGSAVQPPEPLTDTVTQLSFEEYDIPDPLSVGEEAAAGNSVYRDIKLLAESLDFEVNETVVDGCIQKSIITYALSDRTDSDRIGIIIKGSQFDQKEEQYSDRLNNFKDFLQKIASGGIKLKRGSLLTNANAIAGLSIKKLQVENGRHSYVFWF